MSNFDEAKIRRAGDGKFAVKGYSEADGGTDALGAADPVNPDVISGREAIVEHVHSGELREGAQAKTRANHGDGIDYWAYGTIRAQRDANGKVEQAWIETDHGPIGIYHRDNNNLTPPGLREIDYTRQEQPLTAEQKQYATNALGPYADTAALRQFVEQTSEGPGGEQIYDELVFAQEQRDIMTAASLLDERAEARVRVLDADTGYDSMPDPDTDAMYLAAEDLRDVADETGHPYEVADPWSRAESVRQARAVLATPRQGIVNPGFEYVGDSRDDSVEVTESEGRTRLSRKVGGETTFDLPTCTTGHQDNAAVANEKTGRTRHDVGDRYEQVGRMAQRPSHITSKLKSDIENAKAVGYLPNNLNYKVTSSGSLSLDASIDVRVTGLSEHDRYEPGAENIHGDPFEREGVRQLKDRLDGMRGRYGSTTVNHDTDYFRATYYGDVQFR